MRIRYRLGALLVGAGLVTSGLALVAPAASAATFGGQLTLPVAYPQGVAMDALNWAGTGSPAGCSLGSAVTNSYIGVWKSTGAGCASLFRIVQINGGSQFEVLYAPEGTAAVHEGATLVPNGFCVSSYANTAGTFSRLRHCAATLTQNPITGAYTAAEAIPLNAWQTFQMASGGVDDPAAQQIQVAGSPGLCLNDKAFGGNGSHVIVWSCASPRANEAWTTPAAG